MPIEIQKYLYNTIPPPEGLSVDYYTWKILLEPPEGANKVVDLKGYSMHMMDTHMDDFILSNFTTTLQVKVGNPALITHATLAAGYAHCLVSAQAPSQPVQNMMNGLQIPNFHEVVDLAAIFRYKLFQHLGSIIDAIMAKIRMDNVFETEEEASKNFATVVIVLHEISYINSSLRRGVLQILVSQCSLET